MKTIWITIITLAAAAAFGATNAPVPADPLPSGNKFLFVLETSGATARLDHGWRQAVAELIKGVRDVNVFILSDPSVRPAKDLLGDKFTREFIEKGRKARLAKQPVVTTLVARNGAITNWIVSIGNDSIKLPAMAIPLH